MSYVPDSRAVPDCLSVPRGSCEPCLGNGRTVSETGAAGFHTAGAAGGLAGSARLGGRRAPGPAAPVVEGDRPVKTNEDEVRKQRVEHVFPFEQA